MENQNISLIDFEVNVSKLTNEIGFTKKCKFFSKPMQLLERDFNVFQ